MKIQFSKSTIFALIFCATTLLANHDYSNHENGKYLKEIDYSLYPNTIQEAKQSKFAGWTEFVKSSTGKAHRAFGKPIKVGDYYNTNEQNIQDIANAFLKGNQEKLGLQFNNLKFVNYQFVNNKWYVHYKQMIDNKIVVFSNIELRINSNGEIFSYGIEYFDGNDINLENNVSLSEAIEHEKGITKQQLKFDSQSSEDQYIFPIYQDGTYKFENAYRISYQSNGEFYSSYVSTVDGETLYRHKISHDFNTKVNVSGLVRETSSLDEPTKLPFSDMYVRINGERYTTDIDGNIELDLDQEASVKLDLEGPWVTFYNNSFEQGEMLATITPNETNNLVWDESNSDSRERAVVYYLNNIRNYFREFDSTLHSMDFQMELRFESDNDPQFSQIGVNAYSAGQRIGYTRVTDKSANLAETPTVLYHEYGHSINMLLYQELGQAEGMINRAAHEGLADITGALMVDDSRVGAGAFKNDPNRIIRNCKNNYKYPDDIQGEPHHDGQILAGALWDIREYTDLETARNLAHFARYGLPDDTDVGICYSEWLFEVIIADDDDGDLTNGTPHLDEIIKAFDNHNIKLSAAVGNNLFYSETEDLQLKDGIIEINASIEKYSLFENTEIGLTLTYKETLSGTEETIEAKVSNNNNFTFEIPIDKEYGIYNYSFNIINLETNDISNFMKNQDEKSKFKYIYGLEEKWTETFQTASSWEFSQELDFGGVLEIGVPELVDVSNLGLGLLQPTDSFDDDEICLVTGATGGEGFDFYTNIPWGESEAISPIVDLSNSNNPIFNFQLWYYVTAQRSNQELYLTIEFSEDAGNNWVEAYVLNSQSEQDREWLQKSLNLNDYITPNDKFRYKINIVGKSGFGVSQQGPSCISEFLVDDINIYDTPILKSVVESLNSEITVTSDQNNIYIKSTEINDYVRINIFDLNGNLVNNFSNVFLSNGLVKSLPTGSFSSGLYLIQIESANQIFNAKMLVY
jgi:hypothetical protein